MALPRVVLRGRKIILLSGFKNEPKENNKPDAFVVDAEDLVLLSCSFCGFLVEVRVWAVFCAAGGWGYEGVGGDVREGLFGRGF